MSTFKFFCIDRANTQSNKVVRLSVQAENERVARCQLIGKYILYFGSEIKPR